MTSLQSRHGGEIFHFAESIRDSMLDFSININPLGLSPVGKSHMLTHLETDILRYPDTECKDLLNALSLRYQIDSSCMLVGNGATELMYALLPVIQPKKVLIPAPSFSEYRLSAEAYGTPIEELSLEVNQQFQIPIEIWRGKIEQNSLVYVGNPNNPDGHILLPYEFETLLQRVNETNSYLVIDESFVDFLGDAYSYRQACKKNSHLIIISSLTKFFAVPGLRVGYVIASSELIKNVRKVMIPWHVNGPVQRYMVSALADRTYIEKSIKFCIKERRRLMQELSKIENIKVYPGSVNFILCQIQNKYKTAKELQDKLYDYHIIIRQCGNYKGLDETYFRVAVRNTSENNQLIDALRKVCNK